jgi:PhnB protein
MRLDTDITYRGTCEEAFAFYAQHLGGTVTAMTRHGEYGDDPSMPADWKGKVLHAQFRLGDTILMGADIPGAEPMRSAYVTLTLDDEAEAERIYTLLGDGGEIFMKMEKTFFANRFAMLRDRFGTSWMLLQAPATGG